MTPIQIEIQRVTELMERYKAMGSPGKMGANMMKNDLSFAKLSVASTDQEFINTAYEALLRWKG